MYMYVCLRVFMHVYINPSIFIYINDKHQRLLYGS